MRTLLSAALALSLCACLQDQYRIDMAVEQDGFQRRIEWKRLNSSGARQPLDETEAWRLEEFYDAAIEAQERVFAACGHFDGATPDDVGGAGSLRGSQTQLGTLWVYSERFRGQDDPLTQIRRQNEAAALFSSLVRGWLEAELGAEPGWVSLEAFLAERLAHDLSNLLMFLYVEVSSQSNADGFLNLDGEAEEQAADESAVLARMLRYLDERGWFASGELEALQAGLVLSAGIRGEDLAHLCLTWMRGVCARHMGPDSRARSAEAFGFLSSPETLTESWRAFLVQSDWLEAELWPWIEREFNAAEREFLDDPDFGGGSDPAAWPSALAWLALPTRLFQDYDQVEVHLDLDGPPLWSNGHWDPATGELVFGARLDEAAGIARSYPSIFSAVWVRGNVELQQQLLGAVRLEGQALAHYCLWCARLDEPRRRAWDAFLGQLDGSPGALERLRAFRFPDAPDALPLGTQLILPEHD